MNMLYVVLFEGYLFLSLSASRIDCSFNHPSDGFCDWKRGLNAGWRIKSSIKHLKFGNDQFAFLISRSRPAGFHSKIISPSVSLQPNQCFAFSWNNWNRNKRNKRRIKSDFKLKLYLASGIKSKKLIWEASNKENIAEDLSQSIVPIFVTSSDPVRFVFDAVHTRSKSSSIVIDDVTLRPCGDCINDDHHNMTKMERPKVNAKHMLAVRRPESSVYEFRDPLLDIPLMKNLPSSVQMDRSQIFAEKPINDIYPAEHFVNIKARKFKKVSKRRRRKNRNRKYKKPETFDETRSRYVISKDEVHDVIHSVVSIHQSCDFFTYSEKLRACFRLFFNSLQRRRAKCEKSYEALELCLTKVGWSCVFFAELKPSRVEEIIIGTLRNSFQTKEVFCHEEGAFIYPKFPVDDLPVRCGVQYLTKLRRCSSSFTKMFHSQHGNPLLCREFRKASECQRQTTAQECKFDAEAMLLYGLNLQYQFAHNPFCIQ